MNAPRHLSASLVAVGLLCAAGCDEPPRRKADPIAVATAPAEPATPTIDASKLSMDDRTPAFPGFATGRVMNRDGKPIDLPGVRIEVILTGLPDDTQDRINIPLEPDRNGVYVVRLKPGTYLLAKARIEFSFNGSQYRLPLSPHGLDLKKRQEASEGVVQDFIWKLEGPRPGETGDKSRPETWIGGTITPEYRSYRPELGRTIKSPPQGTNVQFTLIPRTPLADGSTGQPRIVVRQYNATQTGLIDAPIVDLPLATWEVRAEEIFPDNTRTALLLLRSDGKWHDSATGTFKADLGQSSLQSEIVPFTRRE